MELLKFAFFTCLFTTGLGYQYDPSPLEDPLEPIWQRLDKLSEGIVTGFNIKMQTFMDDTKSSMETKFQDLRSEMNKTGILGGVGGSNVNTEAVVTKVTEAFDRYYHETIKPNNAEAIKKAEGSILNQISALENKLLEHINVKFQTLALNNASSGSNPSTALLIPTGSELSDMESKITNHITTKLTDIENSLSNQLVNLSSTLMASSHQLTSINTHVTKIMEDMVRAGDANFLSRETSSGGSSDSCTSLLSQVETIMNGTQLSNDFLEQQEIRWKEMQTVIANVKDQPSFLPRDCSDIHWQHHEAISGVYEIYPTLVRKNSRNVWCDMGDGDKADGGWTVILRRRESDFPHLDFNRTWEEYAAGFGNPGEGEWWFSLLDLHSLTYRQPYTIRFLMKDIEGEFFEVSYSIFRVESESRDFRLIVDDYSGNATDALQSMHNGKPFSTPERDHDGWDTGNCALSNKGGWWYNACHYTVLTAPYPTSSDRQAKTIRWLHEETWMVLTDVTVEIRPVGYGKRFDTHYIEEQ